MKPFLIALALATIAAVGLSVGYLVQKRLTEQRLAEQRLVEESTKAAGDYIRDVARERRNQNIPPAPTDADADAAPIVEDEDDEEAAYRDLMARRALTDNCLVCHEEGMFTGQRLTPAQWKSEIDKMIGWGAVLPDVDRGPVEEYLSRHFGEGSPTPPPGRVALADLPTYEVPGDPTEATTEADATKGAQFYKIICASCHGPSALGTELGPALVDRAVLTHAGAFAEINEKGRRKMPAMNAVLQPDQNRDILAWLRGLDAATVANP